MIAVDCHDPPAAVAAADIVERDDIDRLVRAFYRDAATDDLLGPVFETANVDWPTHIDKLTDFWAWQLLGQPGYNGNPLRAHEPVHHQARFTDAHFTRWLDLFTATVDAHHSGPTADRAKRRATKMAHALRRLLDGQSDGPARPITPFLITRPDSPTAVEVE